MVTAVCAAAAEVFAAEAGGGLTEQFLKENYFQAIQVEKGGLLLQLRQRAGDYVYRRQDGSSERAAPGERIAVQPGESLEFMSRHAGLDFTPLPAPLDKHGYFIRHTYDARSFGRGVTHKDVIILISESGAISFVEVAPGLDPSKPLPEDLQKQLAGLVSKANPLSLHALSAETAGGKVKAPFPKSVSSLQFEWKLGATSASAPLEIRWIAADTGGAAPNDTIITTGKSDAGKTEGTFTLSKPTSGFPPGRYRIEIRQAGKMIHSEPFEIEK